MESNDDDEDERLEGDDGIMEFDGLINMEQNDPPMGAIVGSNYTINSSTLMERALAQLVTTMKEITNGCKKGDLKVFEHATSHMKVLACNICNIRLTKANVVLHPRLVLHYVEDGLGNSVKWLKGCSAQKKATATAVAFFVCFLVVAHQRRRRQCCYYHLLFWFFVVGHKRKRC
jgi:hypothetical protein